uniref:Uncharacterized protein n=1 Tax=Candidatus Kentrum sp. LFY TaxID=2126342 RepID=A0A450UB09_9GAMM|nr:MAG: hypothetical protein BECKLFY1418A_GA0070994_100730 [Candidatus Kentron sp. LFY]
MELPIFIQADGTVELMCGIECKLSIMLHGKINGIAFKSKGYIFTCSAKNFPLFFGEPPFPEESFGKSTP